MSIKIYQLTEKFHALGIEWDKIYCASDGDLGNYIESYKRLISPYSKSRMSTHMDVHEIIMNKIHNEMLSRETVTQMLKECSDNELFSYSWQGGVSRELGKINMVTHLKRGFVYIESNPNSGSENYHPKVFKTYCSDIHELPELFEELTPLKFFQCIREELVNDLYKDNLNLLASNKESTSIMNLSDIDPILGSSLMAFVLKKDPQEFSSDISSFINYFKTLRGGNGVMITRKDITPELSTLINNILSQSEYYSKLTMEFINDVKSVIDDLKDLKVIVPKMFAKNILNLDKKDHSLNLLSKFIDDYFSRFDN